MDTGVRTVLMTAPDETSALALARALVEARLAACGNVVPGLTSVYRWQGRVESSAEALVILKTSRDRVEDLLERATELHPYDVPELLVLRVEDGHPSYLRWVLDETRLPGVARPSGGQA
jgi:periplasmic divalent cation tolerance protein